MADADDWKALPTAAKIQHQQWKARQEGYKELKKLFATQTSEKSPVFNEYASHLAKIAGESNPAAQEMALESISVFLTSATVSSGAASDIITGLVANGLTVTRPKTKELVAECIYTLIELERHEIVCEELLKGLSNKNPKLVACCLQTIQECLSQFGSDCVPVKPLFKEFPRLFDHRDKNVRERTKALVVEVRRWIGRPMPNLLSNVKPVVLNELTALFDQLPNEKPTVTRYLRSKRPAQTNSSPGDDVDSQATDTATTEVIDIDDLAAPVDVLKAIPSSYWTNITEKKWQERQAALEALEAVTKTPKILPGDFSDLVKSLLQVVAKDTNIAVTTIAVRILGQLATGLRQKFSPYAQQSIATCLERFKEKKPIIVTALRETTDAVMRSTTLETVMEDVCAALKNKSPSVKAETAQLLARTFSRCNQASLNKKMLKAFTTALCVTSTDTVPEVREGSFAALGTAMRVVTPKHIDPLLADLDELRRNKIKEYCDQMASAPAKSENSTSSSQNTAAAAAPKKSGNPTETAATVSSEMTGNGQSTKPGKPTKPAGAGGAKRKPGAGGRATSSAAAAGGGGGSSAAGAASVLTEVLLSDDQVLQQGNEHFGEELINNLCGSEWKVRLQAVTDFKTKAETFPTGSHSTQVLCRLLMRKPGLKDTNHQVLRLRIETICSLISSSKSVSSNLAELLQPDLTEKIGDGKVGEAVKITLTALAERTSFALVAGLVLTSVPQMKNPKGQSESLDWLNQGIREFGVKLPPKDVVTTIRAGLNATNPGVRQASLALAATLHLFLGDTVRNLFSEEKPAVVALLTAEFDKNAGQTAPKPIRGVSGRQTKGDEDDNSGSRDPSAAAGDGDDQAGRDDATDSVEPDDLLPRVDISDKITPEMLTLLASKNWKERQQGLSEIASVLNSAKLIEGSGGALSGVLTAISKICNDVNKNLARNAMSLLTDFAKALPKADAIKYLKHVQPSVLQRFSDAKAQVRESAVSAMDAWRSRVPVPAMLESEVISDAFTLENSFARAELLKWLMAVMSDLPTNSARRLLTPEFVDAVLPYTFTSLEDRSPEARERAQAILPQLIRVLGWENVSRAAGKLKATSKDSVMAQLEKARESVIATAEPVQPAKPVVRGGGGGAATGQRSAPAGPPPAAAAAAPQPADTDPVEDDSPTDSSSAPPAGVRGGKKKPGEAKKGPGGKKTPAGAAATLTPDEQEKKPPILVDNKAARTARINDEKKRKLLKWDFDTPSKDHTQQLNNLFLTGGASPDLHALLFHSDFKQHIKALDQLVQFLDAEGGEEATLSNLDLLLRWVVLRFFEPNPVVLGRCLNYLNKVFSRMSELGLSLSDQDMNAFVPYLVTKAGDPKDAMRQSVRSLFLLLSSLIAPGKLFTLLCNGTKSKTNKTRQECLEEMGSLIHRFGVSVCQPNTATALKAIASHIGDRDSAVRMAALNALVSAYFIIGEPMWKMLGSLSEKDRSLLEERIKRTDRPPAATAVPEETRPPANRQPEFRSDQSEPPAQQRRRPATAADETLRGERRPPISSARARAIEMLQEIGDLSPEKAPNMPTLLSLDDDVDELFKPIDIPPIKTQSRQPVLNALLRTSPDTASAITMVVTAISSSDLVVSCHALAELDMVLRDEKWYLLMSHVNQILMLIIIQLRQVYTRYFNDPSVSANQLRTLIRCHLATVESLFRRSTLAREASRDSLRELIQSLFNLMLDERLTEQPDGENVIRAINSLSVCILHAANPTRMLSSLIHLLHDSVTNGHFSNRFTQAVLKSIWRITKGMDAIINTFSLDVILFDCHHFLKAFPSPSWKTRKSDVPLRTIKTLLHVICRLQGSAVLNYVDQIPNKEDSELEAYIIRTLKATAGIQVVPSGGANSSDQTKPSVNGVASEQKKVFQPSAATRDKLSDIFKKIASKQPDESTQGINELYEFTQLYPELDLTPHLEQCSQIFQTFIRQALKNIATERTRRANTPTTASGDFSASAVLTNSPARVNGLADRLGSVARSYDLSDEHRVNPKVFMSRLAMLRRQLGIGGVSTTANLEDSPGGLLGPVLGDNEDVSGMADRLTGDNRLQTTLRNLVKPDAGADQNGEDGRAEASKPVGLTADELMDIRRRLNRIRTGQMTT